VFIRGHNIGGWTTVNEGNAEGLCSTKAIDMDLYECYIFVKAKA
jgi:hypothetical protein